MKLFKEIGKKTFIIIFSLILFLSFPMSALAADILVPDDSFSIGIGGNYSNPPYIFPIAPISANSTLSLNQYGSYSGFVTVNYLIYSPDLHNSVLRGLFSVSADLSVYYRPPASTSGTHDNVFSLSVSDASVTDLHGNSFSCISNSAPISSYVQNLPASSDYDVEYHFPSKVSFYCPFNGLFFDSFCYLRVTYVVFSARPLTRLKVNTTTLTQAPTYVVSTVQGDDLSYLDSINSGVDQTNDKLQNLTDGFSDSGINNTNQELSNQLGSYDQAEDAAIDSVTDYFGQIQQPISFFNAGAFLTSTSFVWTYLQGIYDHLGDAKIVVDVVLALTVAFSFIGLGRYIWRVGDREDDS